MRKLLAAVLAVVFAVIPFSSAAVASNPTQGADIYGVGAGSQSLGGVRVVKFSFSAHTGPNGDFGSVQYSEPTTPFDATVDVDCVNVQPFPPGNDALFGGPIKKVSPQPNVYGLNVGDQLMFQANDFGEPSGLTPDEFQGFFGAPQLCKTFPAFHEEPITQGNINIKLG
jgi:hypothetical protein